MFVIIVQDNQWSQEPREVITSRVYFNTFTVQTNLPDRKAFPHNVFFLLQRSS